MVIAANGFAVESAGHEAHGPRDGFPAELITVHGKYEVLAKAEPASGRNCRCRRSKKMGEMCVGSPCSSMVRILPARKNLKRAGSESTLGVVRIATPPGASNRAILRRNPMGLSTCSITSMAVTKANCREPKSDAKSGWLKSTLT